ncbi:hypothetical protein [Nonomuraea sp. B1E8]|uniref:hypothetical protein n=1 Tax=unclassified Nonomuraea TaxID=2593643 RepID=UPI00325DA9DB
MSTKKAGLDALLTPEESVLLLIDHQPFQFANLNSHEPTLVVNNVVGLAKTTKAFGVPTILTTVLEERGGYLIQGLQDVFPEQKPINRTFINTWEDSRVVDAEVRAMLERFPRSPRGRTVARARSARSDEAARGGIA